MYLPDTGTLCKYTKLRFAKLMTTFGCLRVGTLHDFRRTEHAVGIQDIEEGQGSHWWKVSKFVAGSKANQPQDELALKELVGGGFTFNDGASIQDSMLVASYDSDDCFIYCLTRESREYK